MTALNLSYALSLPSDPLSSTLSTPSSSTFTSQLDTSTPRAHLQSLELALGNARDWLNHSLTEWKVALKDVEKETKPPKGDEDEDQD